MSRSLLLAGMLAVACIACDDARYNRPSARLGDADPMAGEGTVRSISATFSKSDLDALFRRLNSPAFHQSLRAYTCGDPVPPIVFTVSIFERAEYQERHVLIRPRPDPSPSGRERCLGFGMGYEIDRAVSEIDRGEPINTPKTELRLFEARQRRGVGVVATRAGHQMSFRCQTVVRIRRWLLHGEVSERFRRTRSAAFRGGRNPSRTSRRNRRREPRIARDRWSDAHGS